MVITKPSFREETDEEEEDPILDDYDDIELLPSAPPGSK